MVKKIFLAFIVATLLVVPSAGAEGIYQLVASGSVTQANARISAAATVAFFDTPDAALGAVLQAKKGHLLKIRDSAGRAIQGYIKAAGSAETLDVNLHTNADFASDEPPGTAWTKGTGITITGGKLTFALTSSQVAWQTFSLPVGGLYKWGFDLSSYVSGTGMNYYFATIEIGQIQTVPASYSGYRTSALGSATYYGISGRGTLNGTGDNVYLQKVLTPSATGVTISSTKGGTALDNWAQKDAAFNYNDSSGYTYEIWKVNDAPVVATGTITPDGSASYTTDLTTASAFSYFGVDLSSYRTGKYILALYNTTGGYAAIGRINTDTPGGETLSAEILNAWVNMPGYSYETWTVTGGEINKAINTTGTGDAYKVLTSPSGKVYKFVNTYHLTSGQASVLELATAAFLSSGAFFTLNGTSYVTAPATAYAFNLGNTAATEFEMTSNSLKQVTDCHNQGVHIGVGTRGWTYKHASFNPNAEMTYKVLYVGD